MSRNRQKLNDLSSKFNIQSKPPRIARPKVEPVAKKQEPSFRSFSKLSSSKMDAEDDMESQTSSLDAIPDLISTDSGLSKPRLHHDQFDDDFQDDSHSNEFSTQGDHLRGSLRDQGDHLRGSRSDQGDSNIEDLDNLIETSQRKPSSRGAPRKVEKRQEIEDDLESISEEPSGVLAVPRPGSRGSRPASSNRQRKTAEESVPQESISRQSLVRLIRSSELQSAGSDLAEAVKELLGEFTKTVLTSTADSQGMITMTALHKFMSSYIENEDRDLNQDVIIDPNHFKRFIRPICEQYKYTIKNDTFYLLHVFVETVLVKVLQGSDMVADAAKRQRVGPKDLLVAYSIYMM